MGYDKVKKPLGCDGVLVSREDYGLLSEHFARRGLRSPPSEIHQQHAARHAKTLAEPVAMQAQPRAISGRRRGPPAQSEQPQASSAGLIAASSKDGKGASCGRRRPF